MIDLSKPRSAARCQLSKIGPKRAGDGEGLVVDLDLAFEIESEEDAREVSASVPGALALWKRGEVARGSEAGLDLSGDSSTAPPVSGGVHGSIAIRVSDPDVRISLLTLGGEGVIDAVGEVSSCRFRSTPKAAALVVRVRALGLDGEEVGSLALLLGETVEATFERAQQALPFEERVAPIAEIGSVVSGIQRGREYAGLVLGRAFDEVDGDLVEIDDFGERMLVRSTSISGSIRVRTEGRPLDEVVEEYRGLAFDAGLDPSWRHLIVALGHEYLAGGETPEGWTLTTKIAENALAVAREVA